jgi:hypothetical protein
MVKHHNQHKRPPKDVTFKVASIFTTAPIITATAAATITITNTNTIAITASAATIYYSYY